MFVFSAQLSFNCAVSFSEDEFLEMSDFSYFYEISNLGFNAKTLFYSNLGGLAKGGVSAFSKYIIHSK